MNYTFKNNGRPYEFTDTECGGGGNFIILSYESNFLFDLRSIKLIKESNMINKTQ